MLSKKNIPDQLKVYIDECDQIIAAINSYFDGDVFFYKGRYVIAEEIRTRYTKCADSVWSYIKKYELGKIEELIFKPQSVRKIFLGKSWVAEEDLNSILCDIKEYSLFLRKELIRILREVPKDGDVLNLNKVKIKFIENPPAIIIGNRKVELTLGTKEYDICKFIFSKNIKEVFSWDEPFDNDEDCATKKCVDDAIRRINQKVKKVTGVKEDLIKCKKKTISRMF